MTLSLLNQCRKCKSKCCKTGELIGSPILSKDEVDRIPADAKNSVKKIDTNWGESYWILDDGTSNKCPCLDSDKCMIESAKPLDCLCYPIKAVYKNDDIVFIVDQDCPASANLTDDFVKEAKEIALTSINRFEKETYNHWLEHNVGWVKPKHNRSS